MLALPGNIGIVPRIKYCCSQPFLKLEILKSGVPRNLSRSFDHYCQFSISSKTEEKL